MSSALFFRKLFKLGITSMSAGSRTNPGGYAAEKQSLEQFEVSDERTSKKVVEMLRSHSYEAVWKDWDEMFETNENQIK
jgi:2-iminoacetate synthase